MTTPKVSISNVMTTCQDIFPIVLLLTEVSRQKPQGEGLTLKTQP